MTHMTRPHAARRLLEHGPLTFADFRHITGWPAHVADLVLRRLMHANVVTIRNIAKRRHYALAV